MKQLIYSAFLLLFFGSCTYPCGKSDGLKINFIDYSEQEISSYKVKRYSKGSNYTTLIDSSVIDASSISYSRRNDTLQWSSAQGNVSFTSDFDYQVLVSNTGNLYQISEIVEPQQEGRKLTDKIYCINEIESCLVNGIRTTLSSDNLYLKK